jgi:hypothetical protein
MVKGRGRPGETLITKRSPPYARPTLSIPSMASTFKEEVNGAAFCDFHPAVGRPHCPLLDWRRASSDRKCG